MPCTIATRDCFRHCLHCMSEFHGLDSTHDECIFERFALELMSETIVIGIISHQIRGRLVRSRYLLSICDQVEYATLTDEEILQVTNLTGCTPRNIPSWCWTYWFPSAIFDSVLFILALRKTVKVVRSTTRRPPRLIVVLLRDSFLYFGIVMAWSAANCFSWIMNPVGLSGLIVLLHSLSLFNLMHAVLVIRSIIWVCTLDVNIPFDSINHQLHLQLPYILPVHPGLSNVGMMQCTCA